MKFLIFLSLFVFVKSEIKTHVFLNFYCSESKNVERIAFHNVKDFSRLPSSFYDERKKNEIYIHGWLSMDKEFKTIIEAHKSRNDINFILIDYKKISESFNLIWVLRKTNSIADTIFEILEKMIKKGFKINESHMVGHSLGCSITSRVARRFKNEKSMPFPRITCLDPHNFLNSFDSIYAYFGIVAINRNDAVFLDVVHTNADFGGDRYTRGHVDFWVNGGSWQKGCLINSFEYLKNNCEIFYLKLNA